MYNSTNRYEWELPGRSLSSKYTNPFCLREIQLNFSSSQTSIRSGNVLGMGKGFHCSKDVLAHDLSEIIEKACQRAVRCSFTSGLGTLLMPR